MINKMIRTIQPKIVSRVILKPSSPTPNHPEIHRLSFFDQYSPSFYGPLVYFYTQEKCQGLDNIAHKSSLLRTSLSRVISQYYPLAGRMRGDEVSVDCNDQGVVFLEAGIELRLSEFLDNPREEIIQLLFPDGLQFKDANLSTPLVVQVTFFECGGMAIAICISHKLMDMASMCSFVFNWATMTRDSGKEISLDFNLGTLYPPLNLPPNLPNFAEQETISTATTRIVFSKSKIAKLKALVAQEVESPTKVELVTAMICKTAMSAAKASSEILKKISLVQTINLRKRLSPPLTEKNVGNFVGGYVVASTEQDNSKVDLKWLVRELRQRKIEYLAYCNSASTGEELCLMYLEYVKKNAESSNPTNYNMYICSSWCRFPYYETDFGWGKPAWVTSIGYMAKNMIMTMDTRDGDGIEAIITLEEPDMALFERDQELLAFALVNPSRLNNNHGPQRRSKL